ncbi:MAG: hypothetical protein A2729_03545 [Candidatus Buchananbacteria bacterium RIFCSPHIGHO2_01_FULL_39_14]|uniref:SIMPL domain-containing protein n=1 Tax=Candidatus Buchananbacteria bacterium RIFCSPHIGHO2_01_FULL_39_14 TaxID=1797532 RepID=A0A1G1XX34_9BACT|nr:MAG: hypothetical protein A2729_03545 [Candidatus Buchananbacteria bacterium RIFCSPHIGHO2_01_FULL_39_14]
MNEKTTHIAIIGGIVIILALLFFNLGEKNIIVSTQDQLGKITVTGEAETDVMPDKAQLYLTIQTEGKDAATVQQDNSKKINKVLDALKTAGVEKSQIETTSYNLYPWDEWDPTTNKLIRRGYRAHHTIVVTTTDIENVGKLLDLAVKNGVNTVDNIQFTLSDQLEQKTKEQLVATASTKAKQKATTLASNLGVSLGKVLSVSESSYNPPIYYASYAKAGIEDAMAAPETSLSPKSVKVNLQVNVEYGIK